GYMFAHSSGLLFLASVYELEEEGSKRRQALEKVLAQAVKFSAKAQAKNGGWGYVADEGAFTEDCVTTMHLQGLRAAQKAGIPLPEPMMKKAKEYLIACTRKGGGLSYNLGHPAENLAITVAALACTCDADDCDGELARRWLGFVMKYAG